MSGPPDGNLLIKIFGTDEPFPDEQILSAGKFVLRISGGQIKSVLWDGKEIARGIAYLLRDANWATARATSIVTLRNEPNGVAGATIVGAVKSDPIRFSYMLSIEADAAGTLRIETEGTALSEFSANRIGLTLLHPVPACSGLALQVTHSDGSAETTRFPNSITASQPVFDIRTLSYALSDADTVEIGLRAIRPDGSPERFEMEDQRNWGDASYKTYIGSLRDPWPFAVKAGDVFRQEITIAVKPAAAHPAQVTGGKVPGEAAGRFTVPSVGVSVPMNGAAEAFDNVQRYGSPEPRYVSAYLRSDAITPEELAALGALCETFDCPLAVELEVHGELADALAGVAGKFAASGLKVHSILACPAAYLHSYQPDAVWPDVMPLDAFYGLVRTHFPGSRIGGGMLSYFTEVNRKWPPAGPIDYVAHSLCSIVHAADDETVLQNIESTPFIAGTIAERLPGMPYEILSARISMRQNPYGAAPEPNPDGKRIAMAVSDPRENGLFGGLWMLDMAEALSRTHADAVCFGALAGPASIYSPEWPGGKRPTFFALEALAAISGADFETFQRTKRQLVAKHFAEASGMIAGLKTS
jgi:D-apionolactonase